MVFVAIIIGLILVIFLIQCLQWNSAGETYGFGIWCGLVIALGIVTEIILIDEIISEPRPTPVDVYQGKITLEYTIRDGVKVDTVLLWKENYGK